MGVLDGKVAFVSGASCTFVAAKHGVVGLMRAYAQAPAPHDVRVNTVHPGGVDTPMVNNDAFNAHVARHPEAYASPAPILPVSLIEVRHITDTVLCLVGPSGRYITGVTLPIDGGVLVR